MATQSIFTQTVRYQAEQLLEQAKSLCDSYFSHSESTVLIAVKKAEVRTLETLSVKTPDDASRKSIASLLNKTLKKLALAEKVLEFRVKAEGNAIDPRVEKLIAKLTSRIENPPKVEEAAFEKLFQCRFKFDHYNKPPKNLATEHALEKARWMIGKLDMQLLQNCHELIEFKESAMSEKYRGFYQNLANPLEAQNLSSAIYAIQYVALCIAHADLRIKTFGLGKTDMWFHGFMANYLKDKSTQFSLEDLIQTLYTDKFVAIPPSNTPLSYPTDANEEEIRKIFEGLIELKESYHLPSMGAFISLGRKTGAIVFHSSGRISIYDPCGFHIERGATVSKHYPSFEMNYGNLLDAIQFFKPEASDAMDPDRRITIKPYCDKLAFERATSQSGGKSPEARRNYLSSLGLFPSETYPGPGGVRWLVAKEEPENLFEEVCPSVFFLQKAIESLTQSTHEGYLQSLIHLEKLKEENVNSLNRIYFHLYHIQDKETPDKVDRNDHEWGMNAFQTEALSTSEQKLRAVQRVLVEEILQLLYDEIDNELGVDNIDQLTIALEEMAMDSDDLPKDREDPAEALFEKFYALYVKAREKDPSLDDPDDEKFDGTFGSTLFGSDKKGVNDIPDEMRLQAIKEVQEDFKTVWRI